MNIYDFDCTIHKGDSGIAFYLYCLKKRPYIALLWPVQALAALLHLLRVIDITSMKQVFYIYFRFAGARDLVESFWRQDMHNIYPWYMEARTDNDVLISASPQFVLEPICRELGIKTLIASRVDPVSGRYTGKNCSGDEKALRFREVFPDEVPDNAYYDRDSDLAVSRLARHGFRIVDGKPVQEF